MYGSAIGVWGALQDSCVVLSVCVEFHYQLTTLGQCGDVVLGSSRDGVCHSLVPDDWVEGEALQAQSSLVQLEHSDKIITRLCFADMQTR